MTSAPAVPAIRLQSGDRMTRHEFHRRYCELPEIRAELIEGVVYLASPLKREDGRPHALVMAWLGSYWEQHPEVELLDNATVLLDVDNEVQPDASLRYLSGQSAVTQKDYVQGAPEFVVEVAVSSVSIDLHDKLNAYRRNGVQEYVVWRVMDQAIDWFRLRERTFIKIEPNVSGIIESETFPGLRLNVRAMVAEDLPRVMATQRHG